MLQVVQHQRTGQITTVELPAPSCINGGVLVEVAHSLISAGTERSSVQKAQSTLIQRALKQPQEVGKALDSLRKEGIAATLRKVNTALDAYKALGYSASGTVVETTCKEFNVGDRVACAGSGYAYHAEYITVPKNLVVKLPNSVSTEDAAYTTLGAIALQGVRQARLEFGMNVAVIGLGLLGQLTVQLALGAGCRVLGLDINDELCARAKTLGADAVLRSTKENLRQIDEWTHGIGVDAVIIAAATESNEPIELALEISRKRGVVVIVGAVGMNVPRSPFYEKEIDLKISCSYGPGRYDPIYEEHGVDYPIGYVRWTENRNMQAFVHALEKKLVDVSTMTTHRFMLEQAEAAYNLITGKVREPYNGILLSYHQHSKAVVRTVERSRGVYKVQDKRSHLRNQYRTPELALGCIGAGSFAVAHLLPALQKEAVRFVGVATTSPVKAKTVADKFGFRLMTTSAEELLAHHEVNTIVCATRHDTHAEIVVSALKAGKHIFVEKPLAITAEQVEAIDAAFRQSRNESGSHSQDVGNHPILMVGFNRRFSAPLTRMKEFLSDSNAPMTILYRVNAGFVPQEHWIQDLAQGGRIVGEGCHFIDCMAYLTGAIPVKVFAEAVSTANRKAQQHDVVVITVKLSDGSIGTLHYYANGSQQIGKEYCEVHSAGKTVIMDNFKTLTLASGKRIQQHKFNGTKGHAEEIHAFVEAVRAGLASPIEYEVLRAVTVATFAAEESLQTGTSVVVT